jgi:MFS family permease
LTTQRIQWLWRPQADLRGVAPLLVMQLISGAWILPQGAFFPIYLEELLHLSPFAIAAIIAAAQAAGLAAALVGGGLTDVLGSKRVLVMGLAGGAVASLVFQTQLPLLVTGLWCLGGMAGSLQTLGASSYLTRAVAPERLGLLSALFALSFTIGGAASNPAAGWLLDASGFSLFGLAGMVVLAAAALLVQLALPAQSSGAAATGAPAVTLLALARRPIVQLLMGLRFLPTVFYGMATVLVPLMLNDLAGNKTTVAIYGTVSLVVASVAQLVAGRAADRYGHRLPTLIGYGTLIVAALGLAIFSHLLWGVFLFGVLGIAAAWALATLFFVLVSDGVPRAEHGRAFGLLHAVWSVAMISGALLGGALTRMAPGLPFLVGGLLNGFSIVLTMVFFAQVQRSRSDETLSATTF